MKRLCITGLRTLCISAVLFCILSCEENNISNNADGELGSTESVELLEEKVIEGELSSEDALTLWAYYTRHRDFQSLIKYATMFYKTHIDKGGDSDMRDAAIAAAYLAQSYLFLEQFDSAYFYLDRLQYDLKDVLNDEIAQSVDVTSAILSMKQDMNYSKALYKLKSAFDHSVALKDSVSMCTILCNIAAIYYERKDVEGYSFASRANGIASSLNTRDSKLFSEIKLYCLIHMSRANLVANNYSQAKSYADSAAVMVSYMPGYTTAEAMLRLSYGDIYQEMGQYTKADSVYKLFSSSLENLEPGQVMEYYNRYGNCLLAMGHVSEAKKMFEEGLNLSYSCKNIEDRQFFLLGLSDVAYSQGNVEEALDFHRKYHSFLDSVSFVQKERDFNQLLMSYDRRSYEKQIHEQEMMNLKANKRLTVIFFLMLTVVFIMSGIYLMYRKKNQMYQELVERHQAYIREVKRIEEERSDYREAASNSQNEVKERELFDAIEKLMATEKVYRHNDISLEKLSDMLDTNRSYISKVINKFSGVSFSAYINKKRVDDAVERLSDLTDDTPLKAICDDLGYNSLSVFYRAFQKETGCPPSKYREGVRKIKHNLQENS